jgi:hypothetical protein
MFFIPKDLLSAPAFAGCHAKPLPGVMLHRGKQAW